jgi:hypothetical protein
MIFNVESHPRAGGDLVTLALLQDQYLVGARKDHTMVPSLEDPRLREDDEIWDRDDGKK